MPLIDWSRDFSVNIRELDSQHKRLVNLINELHDAMLAGKGRDMLGKVLSGLAEYTAAHFSKEEDVMESNGYPFYTPHKREHTEFAIKVIQTKREFDRGRIVLGTEMMRFLKDWLSNHIIKSDKAYTSFLNGRGIF